MNGYAKWGLFLQGGLFSHEEEPSSNTCFSVEDLWEHYATQKKPPIKGQRIPTGNVQNRQSQGQEGDERRPGARRGKDGEIYTECLLGIMDKA